jgi:hypothetical protein
MAATANTVTVACKLPHGLILSVTDQSGMERKHRLNGSRLPYGKDGAQIQRNDVSSGYGLTYGVDSDFFAKWLDENKGARFVKEGLIFAAAKSDSVRDETKDLTAHTRTGLEPIDIEKATVIDGEEVSKLAAA